MSYFTRDTRDRLLFLNTGADFAAAEYESKEWFAELSIPLFRDGWMGEYAALFDRVKNCRTDAQWKAQRSTVRRMRECARQGGDRAAEESCDKILETVG